MPKFLYGMIKSTFYDHVEVKWLVQIYWKFYAARHAFGILKVS